MDPSQDHPRSSYSFGPEELKKRGGNRENIPPRKTPSPTRTTQPESKEGIFECNICLETASLPIVTLCGHLYCWPCIHQWMTGDRSAANTCPVCKSEISREKCIPIYSRGGDKDPRENIPDRPSGHRTEARSSHRPMQPNFPMFNLFGIPLYQQQFQNFGFTAGIGFPFFGININAGAGGQNGRRNDQNLPPEQERERMIAQFFLLLGLLFISYIIIS